MKSVLGTDREIPLEVFFEEYFNCRKHKRNKASQLIFEWDYPKRLTELYEEVNTFKYEIGTSVCFLVHYPKLREVFAADFRDRIIHHVIMNRLGEIIESKFIDDSYNCRKGKGVYYGVRSLHSQIREASENYTKTVWVVKNDLQGFFMSIDKELMWQKLARLIDEEYHGKDKDVVRYLTEKVVKHCPEKNCEIHGDKNGWKNLSKDKSLFTCGEGKGMPIGNLTSQIFANYYMAEFDHVMKERYTYYGRYVDDFFVICNSSKEAREVTDFAERWLRDNLKLTLSRHKTYVQPYYQGIKFIGSVVKRSRIYVGSKTVERFGGKIKELNKKPISTTDACVYLNSYLGFTSQGRAYRIRRDMIAMLDDRYLRDIDVFNDYKKVLSRAMLQEQMARKMLKRYIKKRQNYYRRKYETRRKKSKALDSRRWQGVHASEGQSGVWQGVGVSQLRRRRRHHR